MKIVKIKQIDKFLPLKFIIKGIPYKHVNEKLLKSGFKWDIYYPDKKIDSKYIMLTEDKRIFKIYSYNVFRDCDSFKQIDINLILEMLE